MTPNTSFCRKEKKFIILEHTFHEIQEKITKHIPIHTFNEGFPNTLIETTYLDDANFTLFHEYLRKRNFRFKIRMRRYGYGSEISDVYWVELKVKQNSISSKKRFILPGELLEQFIKGKDISKEIKKANEGLVGAQKTYKVIRKLISLCNLKPVLQTSYERVAFQKKSKKIRITVDRNITHKKLVGASKIDELDAIILESKISGKTPQWYGKMENKLSLLRQRRFSKYVSGINAIYFPKRGKYNFSNGDSFANKDLPECIVESHQLLQKKLNLEKIELK